MKLTKIVPISIISLLLVACGGGGSSESPNSPAAEVSPPAIVDETPIAPVVDIELQPDPNAIYESTAELVASREFLLNHEYELAISYTNTLKRSVYMSVCSDFTDGDEIKVNYNNCLLRTVVKDSYATTLNVPNDKNRLVMAIWYFDDIDNPRFEIWENDNDESTLSAFNVN